MLKDKSSLSGSRAEFPLTAWTVIRHAQGTPSAEQVQALEALVRHYWKPIYAYFRSQGVSRADAEDLAQEFFKDVKQVLTVNQELGRFRDWLRVCLRNFMLDYVRKERAKKRRPPQGLLSLDALVASDGQPFEPGVTNNPEAALDEAWRRDLLDRALREVAALSEKKGRELDYRIFVEYYCRHEHGEVTWPDVAVKYRLPDWKQAARKADWVKEQLAKAIRDEVARYAESDEEIDDEIRRLLE